MSNWTYADAEGRIAYRVLDNGAQESCLVSALPEGTQINPYIAPPVVLPPVSPRQIRQALTRAGLRAPVEAAVAAGDQDTKDWYEFATEFDRTNPHVIAMGVALGVSPAQLDDLWKLAATL